MCGVGEVQTRGRHELHLLQRETRTYGACFARWLIGRFCCLVWIHFLMCVPDAAGYLKPQVMWCITGLGKMLVRRAFLVLWIKLRARSKGLADLSFVVGSHECSLR